MESLIKATYSLIPKRVGNSYLVAFDVPIHVTMVTKIQANMGSISPSFLVTRF